MTLTAVEGGSASWEGYPMNGGNDNYCYTKNSTGQRSVGDAAKIFVKEGIAQELDITIFSASNTFRIADLGCSVGPNTFFAVQNIIEAVDTKCQSQGHDNPEFHVFFNDHTLNDFNTLFKSLPADKKFYAAGVPGSFHGRLFPEASLHFLYSSCSIQWLSKVPKHVINKGRIYYPNAGDDVITAYSNQHAEDMCLFLNARALEIVCGGLMLFIAPARQNGIPHSQDYGTIKIDAMGDCLMEMVNKGKIDEEKVNNINLPIYMTSPQELEEVINQNGCFSMERMEIIPQMALTNPITHKAQSLSMHTRAALEGIIKEQIGPESINELFDLYTQKVQKVLSDITRTNNSILVIVLLKRRART